MTTTWSLADAAANAWNTADAALKLITLSNNNRTATQTRSNAWATIRYVIPAASGKLYVEFLESAISGTAAPLFGLATSAIDNNGYLGAGGRPFSAGIYNNANYVTAGFTSKYTVPLTFAANDVLAIAIDFTAGSIWFARNNTWVNGSNPATGSLPIITFVPATVGPLFAAISFYTLNDAMTLQPSAANQKYAPPNGFSPWDQAAPVPATPGWNLGDAYASTFTLSNSNLSVAGAVVGTSWSSIRNTTGQLVGRLYVEFLINTFYTTTDHVFGLVDIGFVAFGGVGTLGNSNYSCGVYTGQVLASPGFTVVATPPSYTLAANQVIGMAVDFTLGKIWFAQNNAWMTSGNPGTGANPMVTFVPATVGALFAALSFANSGAEKVTLQSTAKSQKYAAPSGFVAWDDFGVAKAGSAALMIGV